MTRSNNNNNNNNSQSARIRQQQHASRVAAALEQDEEEYDDYDPCEDYDDWTFGPSNSKTNKHAEKRGGSNGSGTIYSSKHTRARAARLGR
eukprot:CAMPEP_0172440360 /NCGR_PEP_ID=MMETSP1065-20121228/1001_1 /TAXON_ID=265537 /ORGANISM="Amphiprora paludosa, Strain CCMP125" /LENGTH=90 /DNA_ID=CAMNT_0013189151 /DNA_START=50 /DNA_END=322 /DNA_ORIENTATION=+